MLIRCPTCASGYDLPPHLLSAGRILRCAHCRDAWALQGIPPEVPPASLALVAEARSVGQAMAAARSFRPPTPSRGGPRQAAASTAAAAILFATVAGGMAAVGQRERLVAAFRPSAAVFATLGLPVNLRGLALRDVRSAIGTADGASTLTLEGTIANLRPRTNALPPIRIAVRDAADREIYSWTVAAPKDGLAVGETVPFRARLSTPPREGATLAISFADAPPPAARHLAEASLAGR